MGKVENDYTRQIDALAYQKDSVYAERNKLVAAVAKMAIALGCTAGLTQHDPKDRDWDDDWRNIVMIDLPEGQCSWHIHDSELPLFSFLPPYEQPWDGHSTDEKYQRLLASEFSSKSEKRFFPKKSG